MSPYAPSPKDAGGAPRGAVAPVALEDGGIRFFDAGQRRVHDVRPDAASNGLGADAGEELRAGAALVGGKARHLGARDARFRLHEPIDEGGPLGRRMREDDRAPEPAPAGFLGEARKLSVGEAMRIIPDTLSLLFGSIGPQLGIAAVVLIAYWALAFVLGFLFARIPFLGVVVINLIVPVLMMPHNPARYAEWLQGFGLQKAKDLLALWVDGKDLDTARMDRIEERMKDLSIAVRELAQEVHRDKR